jgi:hypothetical protein
MREISPVLLRAWSVLLQDAPTPLTVATRHHTSDTAPWTNELYRPAKRLCGRCLSEFVDWRYSRWCRYFQPGFVNRCPSNLISGSTPPPLFPVWILDKYTAYAEGWYGVLGLRPINTCRKVLLQVKFFRWWHFAFSSLESYLSTVEAYANTSLLWNFPNCKNGDLSNKLTEVGREGKCWC